jgi:hypothetical protein
VVGIFGYISFVENTRINFFDGYIYNSQLWLNYTIRGLHSFVLLLTIPHLMFSTKRALENLISPLKKFFNDESNQRKIFFANSILNFIHERIWSISFEMRNVFFTFVVIGLATISAASNIRADEFLVLFFLTPLATLTSLVFPPLMYFLISKDKFYHPFKLLSLLLFSVGILMSLYTVVICFMKIINKL